MRKNFNEENVPEPVKASQSLSYCAQMVHDAHRDAFLHALYVPHPARELLYCLYALHQEMLNVHSAVSEEMIGHIRFAWWQEALEELYAGGKSRGQPVLQALLEHQVPQAMVMPLVVRYREHYPAMPCDIHETLDALALQLVRKSCPGAESAWRRAGSVIDRHRQRHGGGRRPWLVIKLLFV